LQSHCLLPLKDASNGEIIELGCVYVVPAHYHLSVKDDRTLVLSSAGRYVYAQSSVDAMFFSVAHAGLACVIAVVLSGLNYDSAEGLAAIRRTGGLVMMERRFAANKAFLPALAMDKSSVDEILPAEEMGRALFKYVKRFI
jgi:two-component system chemotaxis response regulator CheB